MQRAEAMTRVCFKGLIVSVRTAPGCPGWWRRRRAGSSTRWPFIARRPATCPIIRRRSIRRCRSAQSCNCAPALVRTAPGVTSSCWRWRSVPIPISRTPPVASCSWRTAAGIAISRPSSRTSRRGTASARTRSSSTSRPSYWARWGSAPLCGFTRR